MWDDNKTLGIFKRCHSIIPLPTFAGNQNMGNKMEFFFGKIGEWIAW